MMTPTTLAPAPVTPQPSPLPIQPKASVAPIAPPDLQSTLPPVQSAEATVRLGRTHAEPNPLYNRSAQVTAQAPQRPTASGLSQANGGQVQAVANNQSVNSRSVADADEIAGDSVEAEAKAKAGSAEETDTVTRAAEKQGGGESSDKDGEKAANKTADSQAEFDEQELAEIDRLAKRDREVRVHEQAHMAVGGSLAGAASYTYEKGPDGKSYAVAGEVPIDVGVIEGDPKATLEKMEQVQRAALAPAEPSSQDRAVAAMAAQAAAQARAELAAQSQPALGEAADDSESSRQTASEGEGAGKQAEQSNDAPATGPRYGVVAALSEYQAVTESDAQPVAFRAFA